LIKLRLQRKGRKKRPFYHIVVADSRAPRDGRIIERLGRFDNVSERKELTYDEERIIHWLKIGAQPSDTVKSILKGEGILYKMHLMRWGKNEEEIEAALEEWRAARDAKKGDDDSSRRAKQQEILKAEEKEYKKQVEEKAAAAAKALEKQKEKKAQAEAEITEDAEVVAEESADETKAETATEEAPETVAEEKKEAIAEVAEANVKVDEPQAETQAATEEVVKEEAQAETEEVVEEEVNVETEEAKADETKADADVEEEVKAEEPKAEEKEEVKKAEVSTLSTEMNANEAIDHIKNTDIKDLQGFVTDDEERITVQRAWEAKQAE
jgi:small subunit ribosomal protein S16